MKRITKGVEPQQFTDWKNRANDNWQPSWENFQNPEKAIVHRRLLSEQGYLCCYCGRLIDSAIADNTENSALESHIEHFVPRNGPNGNLARSLDYSNLLASCLRRIQPGTPVYCGAAKQDWYDPTLTVSPLSQNVESRFQYDADGHIHPAPGDEGAASTIEHLNLENNAQTRGASPLVAMRKAVIEGTLFDGPEPLPIEDLDMLLRSMNQRDNMGRFPNFAQAIASVCRSLVL